MKVRVSDEHADIRIEIARPSPNWPAQLPNWCPLYRRDQGPDIGIPLLSNGTIMECPLRTSTSSCRAAISPSVASVDLSPSFKASKDGLPMTENASPTSNPGTQSRKPASESPTRTLSGSRLFDTNFLYGDPSATGGNGCSSKGSNSANFLSM